MEDSRATATVTRTTEPTDRHSRCRCTGNNSRRTTDGHELLPRATSNAMQAHCKRSNAATATTKTRNQGRRGYGEGNRKWTTVARPLLSPVQLNLPKDTADAGAQATTAAARRACSYCVLGPKARSLCVCGGGGLNFTVLYKEYDAGNRI